MKKINASVKYLYINIFDFFCFGGVGDGFISLCFIGCGFLRVAQTGAFQSPNPCTEPPLFGGSIIGMDFARHRWCLRANL